MGHLCPTDQLVDGRLGPQPVVLDHTSGFEGLLFVDDDLLGVSLWPWPAADRQTDVDLNVGSKRAQLEAVVSVVCALLQLCSPPAVLSSPTAGDSRIISLCDFR